MHCSYSTGCAGLLLEFSVGLQTVHYNSRHSSALLMSYAPNGNGAGERNRTVVSALARPHSAVEPHPHKLVSPAGLTSQVLRVRCPNERFASRIAISPAS